TQQKEANATVQAASNALDALLDGQPLSALRSQWQSGQQRLQVWQQLETLAAQLRHFFAQQTRHQIDLAQAESKVAKQETHLSEQRQRYKQLKEQVDDKRKLLAQEQRIQSLEAHRTALQPGEACPLCGSHEHPAIAVYQALDVSATQAALSEKETALEALGEEGQQAAARLAELKTQRDQLAKSLGETQTEKDKALQVWLSSAAALQLHESAWQSADVLQQQREAAVQEDTHLSTALKAAEDAEQALNRARDAAGKQELQLQTVQNQLDLLQQAQQTARKRLAELQKQQDDLLQELTTLGKQIATEISAAGFAVPDEPTAWLQQQEGEWRQWQVTQQRQQQLAEGLTRQQAVWESATKQAAEWQARWHKLAEADLAPLDISSDAKASLESCIAQIGLLASQLAQLQGQQEQLQADLARQQKDLEQVQQEWSGTLAASPFSDLATFQSALLPVEERQRLIQLKEQLQRAQHRAQALLQAAADKFAQLQQQPMTTLSLAELEQQVTELDAQRQAITQQLGAIRALLGDDDKRRASQQALFQQISQQSAEVDIWQRLDSLIGSAKGDKYRKFAQGLTLDHLMHLANRHLERLHGRYLLQRKSTGELELEIVDTWQGDVARDTRTLSGGESFLVSLALALALSDLVSHKTSIDSLFLDEGFGTLDGETLEIALDALDTLNATGKMIGVISHVEGMKERIAVQIRVRKSHGQGFSVFET
ncbi:MAG: exonuclease subunit SbcC, partial [Pseudogulbenkiania sp.]|nr:exonuclease subunit SbcC [Pseudogulbenkiania sp.]